MNAHVEMLREMERYADPESRPALQAAIAALEAQGEARAEPTLPVEIHGRLFDVPIRVQLHIVNLRMQLDRDMAKKPAVERLLYAAEHCISAADEGVDYAVTRPMLDAMTTLGLMEKVGRGKWAPTEAAHQFVSYAPPSSTAMRAVVEAAKEIIRPAGSATRMTSGYGHVVNEDQMDELRDALAHPEVKKLMVEGNG